MQWMINGDRPIYQQLTGQLTERIVSGVFPAGAKMPSVRDLAAEAGVNPNTMQRALADLEREGLLYTQRTSGRFVTEDKGMIEKVRQQLAMGRIADFLSSMRLIGFSEDETMELLRKASRQEGETHEH
ncbi:GntR family transcriptional regulator [Intestinibacillus massiliensis]|uniref:GntR family transcriptional regulator n=1 Tax=Intestinibacillus massiliensis TaxID=1871029 RepID=UPI000B35430A|nr:GntR family transcriptional regulator [Intestinibacillus massiliensis]MCB6365944.1 GntR family transcriptional regulator [Intestinibacillus massiliensis]